MSIAFKNPFLFSYNSLDLFSRFLVLNIKSPTFLPPKSSSADSIHILYYYADVFPLEVDF